MRYLAIIIGHTKKDGGAEGVSPLNKQEYQYNSEVAAIAKAASQELGVTVEVFTRDIGGVIGAYGRAVSWLHTMGGNGAIIELHFNAANRKATGTEVLYADKKDKKGINEKFFAECIQAEVCMLFGRDKKTNRGLKLETGAKGERGYSNLSQTTDYPAVIVEPFFGDVESEAKLAIEKQKDYALCLIHAMLRFYGV